MLQNQTCLKSLYNIPLYQTTPVDKIKARLKRADKIFIFQFYSILPLSDGMYNHLKKKDVV